MKNLRLFLWLIPVFSSVSYAIPYWVCAPQGKDTTAPGIIIVTKDDPTQALFHFEGDLVRGQSKLPAGDYDGYLEPSKSGFSIFAKMNIEPFFPNPHSHPNGSWLELALSTKSSFFGVEAYLLWYSDKEQEVDGEMIAFYACRRRNGHSK